MRPRRTASTCQSGAPKSGRPRFSSVPGLLEVRGRRKRLRDDRQPTRRVGSAEHRQLRRYREDERQRRERRIGVRERAEAESEPPDQRERDDAEQRGVQERLVRHRRAPREREHDEERADRCAVHAVHVQVVRDDVDRLREEEPVVARRAVHGHHGDHGEEHREVHQDRGHASVRRMDRLQETRVGPLPGSGGPRELTHDDPRRERDEDHRQRCPHQQVVLQHVSRVRDEP